METIKVNRVLRSVVSEKTTVFREQAAKQLNYKGLSEDWQYEAGLELLKKAIESKIYINLVYGSFLHEDGLIEIYRRSYKE